MREFVVDLVEERASPDSDGKQPTEQHHGIDARTTLLRPVHVLEVEPQRKLVEGERRRTAVENRREFRERVVGAVLLLRSLLVRAVGLRIGVLRCEEPLRRVDLEKPQVARAKESRDSDDEMMEMAPANAEVVKGSDAILDGMRDCAGC